MKFYEIYLILKPTLKEEEIESLKGQLTQLLAKDGFTVRQTETKLSEHLTHLVARFERAHTLALTIATNTPNPLGPEINHWLKHHESILRHLIFAQPDQDLKRLKPMSVIDQLRQRERRAFATPLGRGPSTAAGETSRPGETKPHEADVEAIDKKLEELLK